MARTLEALEARCDRARRAELAGELRYADDSSLGYRFASSSLDLEIAMAGLYLVLKPGGVAISPSRLNNPLINLFGS